MDRRWMNHNGVKDRQKPDYIAGVNEFLEFAFRGKNNGTMVKCPCLNCRLVLSQDRKNMQCHLLVYGIDRNYNPWTSHGENVGQIDDNEEGYIGEISDNENDEIPYDDMAPLVFDATNAWNSTTSTPVDVDDRTTEFGSNSRENETPIVLQKLMEDMEADLYPGCTTFKRLEFIITLMHIKASNKWSDKSFSMLLSTLHRAFNYDNSLPSSSYEAKKYTKALGLDYVKIDACVNHCVLFRNEYADEVKCPKCLAPRWKEEVIHDHDNSNEGEGTKRRTRIPQLVLRHFPLIPRLQRMFMCSKLAKHMRWHKKVERDADDDEGIMKHPRDSKSWKSFDELYPDFAVDARNVRLALASDGFNPGANMSSRYSIWPVMLVPYNLPPWMCMKSDNMMLSLLIPGPKSPGNDIDVFLQPLIDELKELWQIGVKTFDAHSKETFNMRAMLMWTISDFPAYANLSGWSTKGVLACPNCHRDTHSMRLKHGHKWCYMCHRRFLDPDHKWRLNRRFFGGKVERRPPPSPLSGTDVLEQLHGYSNVQFGKENKGKRKRGERYIVHQWKKISVFFQLPYWRHLLVRHNLDVMHVEKNVCESILGTLLDLPGKNKDSLNARLDLESTKMHDDLRPKRVGEKYVIPRAPFNLTSNERRKVVIFLSKLAFPDGYSSNISRCASLEDGKILGMKTHDFHVFMQDLLTPAFQGVLDERVLEPLRELSLFFKQLCSKTLKVADLERMERNIGITLCKLERIFIPAFFDVMIHLPIHLATEAKLAGPVHYRWMYRFERAMQTFKSFVRNKAHPEGSIAEGYIEKEFLAFCARYLSKIETQFNRLDRNEDVECPQPHNLSIFSTIGKPLGKATLKQLSMDEWRKARLYVLRNCEEAQPFFDEYENTGPQNIEFCKWFENRITQLWKDGDEHVTEELLCLARGPMKGITTYDGFVINGFRFHTKKRQRNRKTQNSGIVVKGDAQSGGKDFYGVLEEVIILEYDALKNRTSPKVVLFRSKWFDVFNEGRGIRTTNLGSTLLNFSRTLQTNEPFAIASQVEQVFYVASHNEPHWKYVIKAHPRNFFDFPNDDDIEQDESLWDNMEEVDANLEEVTAGSDEEIPLVRDDIDPEVVDADVVLELERVSEMDKEDEDDEEENEEDDEDEMDVEPNVQELDEDLEDVEYESDSNSD